MAEAEREDTGAPSPRLVEALAGGDASMVAAALLGARVLVPILAAGEESTAAEMAVPGLVGADGRVALPAFSGTASLARWRLDARPVPMSGAQAVVAAIGEGYAALVLDVAGPVSHVVDSDRLEALAAAAHAMLDSGSGTVLTVPE